MLLINDEFKNYVFDTYDQIIENPIELTLNDNFELEGGTTIEDFTQFSDDGSTAEDENFGDLTEESLALSMAVGSDLNKDAQCNNEVDESEYELDFDTDIQNWRRAMSQNETNNDLRPFEQYIQEICNGQRKMFGAE